MKHGYLPSAIALLGTPDRSARCPLGAGSHRAEPALQRVARNLCGRGSRAWSLLAILAFQFGCESPDDTVFDPSPSEPIATSAGNRLTHGAGPDVVRGVTSDGRVVFHTRDLLPFDSGPLVATIAVDGGPAREEAATYRRGLRQTAGTIAYAPGRRVLAAWTTPVPGAHGCPPPAPDPPPVVYVTLYELSETDGAPIPSLPQEPVPVNAVAGAATNSQRIRITPAQRELRDLGANPFGPVPLPDGSLAFSDGERVWRGRAGDATPATLIGDGAYPALRPDGVTLAYARGVGVDSTSQTYAIPVGLGFCVQEQVEITSTGWQIVLHDLGTGQETPLGDGLEPAFDPLAPRLAIRLGGELRWLGLDGTDLGPIPGTAGAFSPAIAGDGSVIAYSVAGSDGTDAYFRLIVR